MYAACLRRTEPDPFGPVIGSWSILLLGAHPERRLVVADDFRSKDAVVVEAATVHRAGAILRHFRFDMLAVDPFGLGSSAIELLHDLGVYYPDMHTCVIALPAESNVLV